MDAYLKFSYQFWKTCFLFLIRVLCVALGSQSKLLCIGVLVTDEIISTHTHEYVN